jgi:hypothetical protein
MKNFLRITAGVYVLFIGFLMLMIGAISMLSGVKGKEGNAQVMALGLGVIFFCAVCFVLVGVGIIIRKNWARICLLAVSWFGLFEGIAIIMAAVFLPLAKTATHKSIPAGALFVTILFLTIFLVAIPVYFLIFFTRKSVKEIFAANLAPNNSAAPFGIRLLAVSMVLGGFGALWVWAIFPFNRVPMPLFFGITLSKWQGIVYMVAHGILDLVFGIGLYKLKYKAWVGTICLYSYAVLASIAAYLTFNQEQYNLITNAMISHFSNGVSQLGIGEYRSMYLACAGIAAVILWYLFYRRKAFVM